MQVVHRRPGAVEPVLELLQRLHQRVPVARGRIGGERIDPGLVLRQQRLHRRHHVRRVDGTEGRQLGGREQGIGFGHGEVGGGRTLRVGARRRDFKHRAAPACPAAAGSQ